MMDAPKTVALKADFAELDRLLRESAADAVLDDDEKFELRELGERLSRDRVRYLRNRAFDLVRERWTQPDSTPLTMLRWLEQVVKTLDASADPPAVEADAFFSPGEDCLRKLRELCLSAKRSIDVCVYTIADDQLDLAQACARPQRAWIVQQRQLDRRLEAHQAPLVSTIVEGSRQLCAEHRVAAHLHAGRRVDGLIDHHADDRLTEALIDAHRRGLTVRILSDNHKVHDTGSDVHRLRDRGIDVRLDDSDFHMHHKFALFDGARLANGSFNWTRGASTGNEENLVVTDDVRLVRAFAERFGRLWDRFAPDRQ